MHMRLTVGGQVGAGGAHAAGEHHVESYEQRYVSNRVMFVVPSRELHVRRGPCARPH